MKKEINDLQNEIADLKSQLANIRYLNADEVRQILLTVDLSTTGREHLPKITRALDAICKLAIPDIDRDKIVGVLREHNYKINEINMTMINDDNWLLDEEKIADEIIKAIRKD